MQSYKTFRNFVAYMMKNLFIRFGFLAILLFVMSSCGHKSTTPKRLDIPTGVVSVDTVAHAL